MLSMSHLETAPLDRGASNVPTPEMRFAVRGRFEAALANAWRLNDPQFTDENDRHMAWFMQYAKAFAEVFDREGESVFSMNGSPSADMLLAWQKKLDAQLAKTRLSEDLSKLNSVE